MQMGRCMEYKMHSKRKVNDFNGCYLFLLTLLEVLGKTHMSVHDNNHAFIQANSNEVRFMEVHEGLQVFMHKDMASSNMRISQVHEGLEDEDAFSSSTYLKFVPPQLDFKERFLGVPHLEKVTLVNTDENKTIHMSSVSGNTLHFHSSFFQDKAIPPKGNTTFAVVFLGRAEGQVSTNLYIHTSEGTFKYQVSGASICNPYRLRPLGGVRLPLNAAFQPLIQLHNPHHYPIQVVEVYSSGSEFHLELPGGEVEGPKALWEVPPYTTKPVIRAKFQANAQSNHTAYIRLKLNNSEEVLVVPLEVEVTSQPGLYSQQHSIDFGIGGSQDEPKKIRLYLCSSLKKSLRIQSVSTIPEMSSLKVNFGATKIPPGTSPVEVAELIFDWKLAFQTKQTSGKIIIKSKQNQYKLGIPFTAKVLEGGLRVDELATRFLTTENKLLPKNLVVENRFHVSVAVNNISLLGDAYDYFEIKYFKPIVIPPQNSVNLLTLMPKETIVKNLKLESSLIMFTNISDVTVPLLVYNGKLAKIFPRGYDGLDVLDFGLVGCATTKTLKIGLQNLNPVVIEIQSLNSDSPFVSASILGIHCENSSEFLSQYAFANLTNSTKIKPNSIIVLEFVIEASENEEVMTAEVTVSTQYENLTIPVKMVVSHGALEMVPNQMVLDDCFPGKICTQPLKILSTFSRTMTATSVCSVPPDSRLSFAPAPGGSEILPGTSSYIGDLKWEPGKFCGNHCYLGINQNSSDEPQWMLSESLSSLTADTDAVLLRERYHRLLNLTNGFGSGYWQDVMLKLDTNAVREELFKAKVRLIWPKFSNTNKIVFPLTQVSNTTVQRLKLFNSASHVVVVQMVMEWAYPQSKRLFDSFPPRSSLGNHCFNSSPREFYFSSSTNRRGTINATLLPGDSYEVPIMYTPDSPQKSCSLLFIRNNLTVVEMIEMTGQASHAELKFGNRKPGSENPLMFEIAEKHLRDCNKEKKDKKSPNPNLTVKRSFTVRNVGELSIYIHNFYINGHECEGFGYSVLNCGSFELPINGTKKIDVAFTPDFTLTKVQRTLTIDTSLGIEVNYTLVTTLPPLFLSACSSVLSRPTWEPLLYYSAVSFMVFLLFCVLAAAFFESDRILKCALMTLTRERTAPPLDLRHVGTSVAKEFGHSTGKKPENHGDYGEKTRVRENSSSGPGFGTWSQGASVDDKNCGSVSKEDKLEGCGGRSDDSLLIGKEKDVLSSTGISGFVQLNSLTKHKKKLAKKNSSNSDVAAEQMHELVSSKKKDKNFQNSSWCSVFSRGNVDKIKAKTNLLENENGKHVRHDVDAKKEESKKDDKKINKFKKTNNREVTKEEEETSSTTTDSSNDVEKDSTEAATTIATGPAAISPATSAVTKTKSEKVKRGSNKEGKSIAFEGKESMGCDWDYEDDEIEKEKKTSGKSSYKMNAKYNKIGNSNETAGITAWKPNGSETPKLASTDYQKHKINKNVPREKKEKAGTKRRFEEKVIVPKAVESSVVHRSSPCWEHRSFSEVVARNDSPSLYSSVVTVRNEPQKHPVQAELVYSEPEKTSNVSASTLGPIGSKKPVSHWSPLSYSCPDGQGGSGLFGSGFVDVSLGTYLQPQHAATSDFPEEKSHLLEDSLPTDPENLWEDQHAAMQLMHQQDADYQMSWKENWPDYLWCSNRNVQQPEESMPGNDGFGDRAATTWGSLLRSSWTLPPTPWSPSSGHGLRSESMSHHYSGYDGLPDGGTLMGPRDSQSGGIELSSAVGQPPGGPGSQVLFGSSTGAPLLRTRSRDNLAGNGIQFDPFHSLSSIWAPKNQNTWNSPGN